MQGSISEGARRCAGVLPRGLRARGLRLVAAATAARGRRVADAGGPATERAHGRGAAASGRRAGGAAAAGAAAADAAGLPGPPVPPAIAARFPEPAVSFATPAFEPGRTAFTTQRRAARDPARPRAQRRAIATRGTDVAVLPLGTSQAGAPIEALAFTRPPPLAVRRTAASVPRRPRRAAASADGRASSPASTATSRPAPRR